MAALKILLLTDFSPLSKVAMTYAAKMSTKLDVEFTIVNFVRVDGVPKSNLRWRQIEKAMIAVSLEEGEKMAAYVRKISKPGIKVEFKAIKARTVAETVKRYTEKYPTNLIVMGSKGASQLKKARLGGTTVSVIDSNYAPVLAIPEFAEFRNFNNVVYATDLKNIQRELDLLVPFAKIFGSRINMVHVVPAIDKKVEAEQKTVEGLIKGVQYPIEFKLLIDDNVPSAIDYFIQETRADLLTTFTHELTLFEKLFARSVTRTLAYQAGVPLLAFKRKS